MKKTLTVMFMAMSMVFMSSCCCNTVDLSGKWNIASVNDNVIDAADSLETAPFIEFNTEEGKIHGNTSCNIMNGKFTIKGNKLSFSDMATTMMAGPSMDLEKSILDAVNATISVKKADNSKLQILDKDGNVLMTLSKAE